MTLSDAQKRLNRANRFGDGSLKGCKPSVAKKIAHDGGKILTNKKEALLAFFAKKGKTLENLNETERAALAACEKSSTNCVITSTEEVEARSCAQGLERQRLEGRLSTTDRSKKTTERMVDAPNHPVLSAKEKTERKLLKKLRQIEQLEQAVAKGETLEQNQLHKMNKKAEIVKELQAARNALL